MPFERIDGRRAGRHAVGILVPPGMRTVVVLRPRALAWDLVAVRLDDSVNPPFWLLDREEAAAVASQVQRMLERPAAEGGVMRAAACPIAEGFQVRVSVGELLWVLCRREPGRPYQPVLFLDRAEAETAAALLARVLSPDPAANQQYYVNTQNFSR